MTRHWLHLFLQDKDISVLKLTDISFMKDQKYKLTLEISRDYYGNYGYNSKTLDFGLHRIAHCSNNGN